MVKKLSFAASRHSGARFFRWSALALAGVTAGMLLGEMAVGARLGGASDEPATYSHLSANPDALVPQGNGAAPCLGCSDSYGFAARLHADRDATPPAAFRALGEVDADRSALAEPVDDYRYGGRFPDPDPGTLSADDAPLTVGDPKSGDSDNDNEPPSFPDF